MPKRPQFTEEEVVKAWRLKAEGKTHQQIGQELNRSTSGITKLLKKKENFKAKHRSGRPKLLSKRDERRIL
jgi:transposase